MHKQSPKGGIPNPFPWSPHAAAALGGGYVCLVVAIVVIGVLTAIIGDIANHLGCTIYLKDSVTATTIVALGTSMPGNADSSLKLSNTSVTSTRTRSQSASYCSAVALVLSVTS